MLTGTEPQLPSRHALKISLICHSATCTKRLRRPTTSSEKPRGTDRESESLKVDLHASRAEIFRELERRWAQIPVGKEYHTEPEQVEFPQAAWSETLLRDFREGLVPCTEADPEKLWSALLVAAGLMLGRNVRLENPKPIYVNFYTLQVGETGDARKSTVLWITAELLRRVDDDDVEILSGMVSIEQRSFMYRRDLQRFLSRKISNGELFARALKALDANGFIKPRDAPRPVRAKVSAVNAYLPKEPKF